MYTAHRNADGITWDVRGPQGDRISGGWTQAGAQAAVKALAEYPQGWTHA